MTEHCQSCACADPGGCLCACVYCRVAEEEYALALAAGLATVGETEPAEDDPGEEG